MKKNVIFIYLGLLIKIIVIYIFIYCNLLICLDNPVFPVDNYKIVILLHLYDLDQSDYYIKKINKFIGLNTKNDYYIKVNIPIDKNINAFNVTPNLALSSNNFYIYNKILKENIPYHKNLITFDNCKKLNLIIQYLKQNFNIEKNKIQIIFSENRGLDIGGFYILLDQLFKQNIKQDFVIKLHTKTNILWRDSLTFFLNIKIDNLLLKYDCIYSDRMFSHHDPYLKSAIIGKDFTKILEFFKLKPIDFSYCGGSMFIVSKKFTEFLKHYDMMSIYNGLNLYDCYKSDVTKIEHMHERFFGYLSDYLKLRVFSLNNLSERSKEYIDWNKANSK